MCLTSHWPLSHTRIWWNNSETLTNSHLLTHIIGISPTPIHWSSSLCLTHSHLLTKLSLSPTPISWQYQILSFTPILWPSSQSAFNSHPPTQLILSPTPFLWPCLHYCTHFNPFSHVTVSHLLTSAEPAHSLSPTLILWPTSQSLTQFHLLMQHTVSHSKHIHCTTSQFYILKDTHQLLHTNVLFGHPNTAI